MGYAYRPFSPAEIHWLLNFTLFWERTFNIAQLPLKVSSFSFDWLMLSFTQERNLCGSDSKESAFNAGDPGLIPGLGRSPGEENGYPLQYSCQENSMDYSPWGCKESDTTERLWEWERVCVIFLLDIPGVWSYESGDGLLTHDLATVWKARKGCRWAWVSCSGCCLLISWEGGKSLSAPWTASGLASHLGS